MVEFRKNYPGLQAQIASHDAFIKEFSYICLEAERGRKGATKRLRKYLNDWWDSHILEDDIQYKSYL